MPRWLIPVLVVAVVLSWIPLAMIARARVTTTDKPRLHVVPDMDSQPKLKAQAADTLFADTRAMRPPVPGAVARDQLSEPEEVALGQASGEWVTAIPVPVTEQLMRRGQERFDIFCSPCHGLAGNGDGMVARRADKLQEGTWTPPSSMHSQLVLERPVGHLFNTITNGIRTMPPYGPQISVHDRWAVVAYVKALQRSQRATLSDVPEEQRQALR